MRTQDPEIVRERIRRLQVELRQLRLWLRLAEIEQASRQAAVGRDRQEAPRG